MRLGLDKASGKSKCRHQGCLKKPEYISPKGRIKKDTTCVWIAIDSASGGGVAYYCRDCVDKIHDEMKKILNPKLWIFI
jgi:hypothetical protein